MQFFNQIFKDKACTILFKKKYDPKIEMIEYLEFIGQNKIWLVLTLPQKCENSLALHLVIQFQISDF